MRFARGEIVSFFPSILTDTFGTKHATTHYGFLPMAQGIGSLFGGPIAASLSSTLSRPRDDPRSGR